MEMLAIGFAAEGNSGPGVISSAKAFGANGEKLYFLLSSDTGSFSPSAGLTVSVAIESVPQPSPDPGKRDLLFDFLLDKCPSLSSVVFPTMACSKGEETLGFMEKAGLNRDKLNLFPLPGKVSFFSVVAFNCPVPKFVFVPGEAKMLGFLNAFRPNGEKLNLFPLPGNDFSVSLFVPAFGADDEKLNPLIFQSFPFASELEPESALIEDEEMLGAKRFFDPNGKKLNFFSALSCTAFSWSLVAFEELAIDPVLKPRL